MQIRAVMYGYGRLNLIGDSATEADVDGLVKILNEAGTTLKERKQIGNKTRLSFVRGDRWGGTLTLSQNRGRPGIGDNIKIAMLPYEGRLVVPTFFAGEFSGDEVVDKFLQSYPVLEIILPEDSQLEAFRSQFPQYAARYTTRVQGPYEVRQAQGLGIASIPELW